MKVLGWMFTHWKATIALLSFFIASIFTPSILASLGFLVDTKTANAMVIKHDGRINALEVNSYETAGRLKVIVEQNQKIIESNQQIIFKTNELIYEIRQSRR